MTPHGPGRVSNGPRRTVAPNRTGAEGPDEDSLAIGGPAFAGAEPPPA